MAHEEPQSVPPRFRPGDEVRVKYGVRIPDFPDIPLGGWAGTVKEAAPRPKECDLDEEGLLCEARSRAGPFDIPLSEVEGVGENRNLVEDYGYWFHNGR